MSYTKPSKNGYFIYSKSNCPSCEEAKKLLSEANHVNCDEYLEDVDEFLEFVWGMCGDKYPRSFPMIFLDGNYIGGLQEVKSLENFNLNAEF
tara:strand:+ start:103 stop:378 length:276 start_codon:yes stop_codon:yes gene_type:complete